MFKGRDNMKVIKRVANLLVLLGVWIAGKVGAQQPAEAIKNALPGSTQPGVIGKILATPPEKVPDVLPPLRAPEERPVPLGPEA